MDMSEIDNQIVDLLTNAYPSKATIGVRLQRAGIEPATVDFDGPTVVVWPRAWEAAKKASRAVVLLEQLIEDRAVAAYKGKAERLLATWRGGTQGVESGPGQAPASPEVLYDAAKRLLMPALEEIATIRLKAPVETFRTSVQASYAVDLVKWALGQDPSVRRALEAHLREQVPAAFE